MIDRTEAEAAGFKVSSLSAAVSKAHAETLEKVQAVLPSLVNGDGLLDTARLTELLGIDGYAPPSQGYGLNFAGKGLARVKADEPPTQELQVVRAQSLDFDRTGNVVVRGDNLDVLKILAQCYHERIKMIYIDPPYNTENANFIYKDSFRVGEAELVERYGLDEEAVVFLDQVYGTATHSGWLFAMYPRLKIARGLLTEDGIIAISIDDKEYANLKLLCDEIFGEPNHLATIAYQNLDTIKNDATYFSGNHEYLAIYAKSLEQVQMLGQKRTAEHDKVYKNPDNDPRGSYLLTPLHAKSGNENNRFEYTFLNGTKYTPPPGRYWRYSKESLHEIDQDQGIYFPKNGGVPQRKTFRSEVSERINLTTFWDSKFGGSTRQSNKELKEIFGGGGIFDNPKPTKLVRVLLDMVDTTQAIILDFFAGSGTTAHAVMAANLADGGQRKFVLVQSDEPIDPDKSKAAYTFCESNGLKPVISSICIERVKRVAAAMSAPSDAGGQPLDLGFRVFSTVEKPSAEHAEDGAMQITLHRSTHEDVLYNLMAASGEVLLTDPVEEVEAGMVYKVGEAYFVLGECKTDLRQPKYASSRIYVDGYADIRLAKWLNALGLDKELVKILY